MPALSLDLDDAALDRLADQIAARILDRFPERPGEDGWLDSRGTAAYLGVPLSTVRAMLARGELPAYQDRPHGNYYCKPVELDEWRRSNLPLR